MNCHDKALLCSTTQILMHHLLEMPCLPPTELMFTIAKTLSKRCVVFDEAKSETQLLDK